MGKLHNTVFRFRIFSARLDPNLGPFIASAIWCTPETKRYSNVCNITLITHLVRCDCEYYCLLWSDARREVLSIWGSQLSSGSFETLVHNISLQDVIKRQSSARQIFLITAGLKLVAFLFCRSQWPRGLRRRSVAARLLRSWVRIPRGAWMVVCCECCVLSGRGFCDELITRSEKSYRLCCVVVCDLETSRMGAPYIYIWH